MFVVTAHDKDSECLAGPGLLEGRSGPQKKIDPFRPVHATDAKDQLPAVKPEGVARLALFYWQEALMVDPGRNERDRAWAEPVSPLHILNLRFRGEHHGVVRTEQAQFCVVTLRLS